MNENDFLSQVQSDELQIVPPEGEPTPEDWAEYSQWLLASERDQPLPEEF